jgi:hypothetical protein
MKNILLGAVLTVGLLASSHAYANINPTITPPVQSTRGIESASQRVFGQDTITKYIDRDNGVFCYSLTNIHGTALKPN